MSLFRMYDMSRRSFSAFSAQMNTAGQNIANANSPGYSRRRMHLQPASAPRDGFFMRRGPGAANGGVDVRSFERMRDNLLSTASWEAQAGLAGSEEEARLLGALEGVFGVGSGASLPDVMDSFWNAWGDLASNPTDPSARGALVTSAETVADTLNGLDTDIQRLGTQTREALDDGVRDANALLDEIADLNEIARSARAAGSPDLAAEDRRDAAVAELSAFAPVNVSSNEDGYHIQVGGMTVLQGDQAEHFRYEGPPDSAEGTVYFGDTDVAMSASTEGKLGAWTRTLRETIPQMRDRLDSFSESLVTQVNDAHQQGHGIDEGNSTGLNFFRVDETTGAGMSAGSIAVSDAIIEDPDLIAAADAPDAPGDSDIANQIAGLRSDFDTDAADVLSGVGSKLRSARSKASAQAAVADHLAAMERATSGVDIDEEMTKLLEAQQAFAASARVLNTVEEMVDTLFTI